MEGGDGRIARTTPRPEDQGLEGLEGVERVGPPES